MTKEQMLERLQELWIKASNSCGGAGPQALAEIREIEKQLEDLQANQA